MAGLLPQLFFEHFQPTSFVIEEDGKLQAFLVGFRSQTTPTEVHAITSPVNRGSIAFHTNMGFEILPGDAEVDGIAVTTNYDGQGSDRVQFRRYLEKEK